MLTVAALATADVATGVLVVAGMAKVRQPASFATFLRTAGIRPGPRRSRQLAQCVGVGEIALAAAAAVVGGGIWFGALGVLYLALAAVSARAVAQRAPSCGCFGEASAPTTASHVVLDLLFALGALGAAANHGAPLLDRLHPPLRAFAYVALVGLAAALAIATMTTAADLASLRRSPAPATPRAGRR